MLKKPVANLFWESGELRGGGSLRPGQWALIKPAATRGAVGDPSPAEWRSTGMEQGEARKQVAETGRGAESQGMGAPALGIP